MLSTIVIIILMILMIISLGSAFYYMITDRGRSNRTVKALAMRVGIWVVLFAFIAIGIGTGFIKPSNSLRPKAPAASEDTAEKQIGVQNGGQSSDTSAADPDAAKN